MAIRPLAVAALLSAGCERAAAAACNLTLYSGYDLNGGDLPGQPVSKTLSTPEECASLCCSTAGCWAFSLNAGGAGSRWCYLKASSGWTNTTIAGVDSGSLPPAPPNTNFTWFNVSLPFATRVAALVDAMTVDEQISWLDNGCPAIPRLGLPAYDWEGEALHGVAWAGVATVFPSNIAWGATFDVPLVRSIGSVIATEARAKWLAGLAPDGSSAEFHGLSFMTPNNNLFINPSWGRGQETYGEEPTLVSAMTEAHIHGLQWDWPPTGGGGIMTGDTGRATNAAGEPYMKILAVSKHFLAYHLESLGTNGQYRLSHSFNVTETDIQQTYLPPFAAAARAGVASYMCAYDGMNGTNPAWPTPGGPEPWGTPMCLHPSMDRLLRQQLNWSGYVISDEGAITFSGPGYHGYTPTVEDAACLALNAGTDLALGGEYGSTLASCLANGNVTAARIAEALTRVLSAQFQLGWFDTLAARSQGFADPVPFNAGLSLAGNVSSPAHRALSLQTAQEGLVLLKNAPVAAASSPHSDGSSAAAAAPILPLALPWIANKRVALVGPGIDYSGTATSSYIGSYSACEDGPGGNLTADSRCHVVTLLEAMTANANLSGFTLTHAAGCDINTVSTSGFPAALAAAAGADAIIAAVGLDTCQESYCSEGEANDRGRGSDSVAPTLELPGSQLALLQAIRAANPATPLVVVLMNGGPVSSPWSYANADAVLDAWYGGYEAGDAIASAMFGAYSPAGRLPVTIHTGLDQVPDVTDFNMATPPGRTSRYYTGAPQFPFGFGLSYANFTYDGLQLDPPVLAPTDAAVTVSATVTYAGYTPAFGPQPADEVVQVYGSFNAASTGLASIPRQQLLNFTRLHSLQYGSDTPVSFTIPREAFTLAGPDGVMRVAAGQWSIYIGGGPPSNEQYGGNAVLTTSLTIAAPEEL